jgi:RNA polymerase sigma-B factor
MAAVAHPGIPAGPVDATRPGPEAARAGALPTPRAGAPPAPQAGALPKPRGEAPPAPQAGVLTAPRRQLAELGTAELLAIAQGAPRGSGRAEAAREVLVLRHRSLVLSCVHRFRAGPGAADDLVQVGYEGLMKAINSYDPAAGGSLAAYAQPTILGELKGHFRDDRWPVHVQRSARELARQAATAAAVLAQELGRAPGDGELAGRLGVDRGSLENARLAEAARYPASLNTPVHGPAGITALAELLGEDDRGIEHMLDMRTVATHWGGLPARERDILAMRFGGDLTQAEIGARIGLSQMQVSRLLTHALGYLRPYLVAG